MRGVYVTVRVTTSRMWRMLVFADVVVDAAVAEDEVVVVDVDDDVLLVHLEQPWVWARACACVWAWVLGDLNSA